jgi:molybdenum cofactor cytidylyltransferase/nicotine blue oxidoreductase
VDQVAAAVLAAGSGSRMGGPKAELVINGARLLDRAVALARAAGCRPIYAVVRGGTDITGARAVVNPDPARGMRSSLALAVEAASGAPALAVLLVDMPDLSAAGVRQVVAGWRPGRVVVARYGAVRAHPTVMSPDLWRAAIDAAGPDEGARTFLAAHPEIVDEVEVAGDPADLDTPEDLARWTAP